MKYISVLLQDNLNNTSNPMHFQPYSMTVNIIESEIKKKLKLKNGTNKISFLNKVVELIIAFRIFHDLSVNASLHTDIKSDDPTFVYSLTNPRRSKTFNFNKFIRNLDVKAFLQDSSIFLCHCKNSDFKDKDYQHDNHLVIADHKK